MLVFAEWVQYCEWDRNAVRIDVSIADKVVILVILGIAVVFLESVGVPISE